MKKLFTIFGSIFLLLNTQAQWTAFPGSASEISCATPTQLAIVTRSATFNVPPSISRYNFTTNQWDVMATSPPFVTFTHVGIGNDGAMWGRRTPVFPSSQNNLFKFNGIPATTATTMVTGALASISVLNNNSAVGAVGTANNNVFITSSTANTFSLVPFSQFFSGKKVVFAGNGNLLANSHATSGNNIFDYSSFGLWNQVPSSTIINATDIAAGQNTSQILAVSGGRIYYYDAVASNWVLDATSPTNVERVTMATDGSGKVYITTAFTVNNILTNDYASIICGIPSNNTPASSLTVCANNPTTLSVLGNNITWYTQATGGSSVGSGNTFITPFLNANTTYYAQSGTCPTRTAITVTIGGTLPPSPNSNTSPANLVVCEGAQTTLSVSGTGSLGGSFGWYTQATGGTLVGSNQQYTTPLLFSNTTYYVEWVLASGCVSATRTPITVTVVPQIQNTTPSANQTICVGSSATLSASGTNVTWYTTPTGGTSIGTGNTFTTPILNTAGNVLYYAQAGNCTPRLTIAVSVLFIQSTGTISGNQQICLPGTTTFSSTAGGGTWSSSNTAIATVNPTTGVITGVSPGTATITYTVPGTIPCANGVGTRTVTVATNSPGVISLSDTICLSGGGPIFASSTVSGGSWSSSNTAILGINASTGFVFPNVPGTVTVSYAAAQGICGSLSTSKVLTIIAVPNAGTLSGNQTICLPGTTTFSSTGSGGAWSSSNTAVATVNAATGVVTGVAAGTATITYTVPGGGGCTSATATRTIEVFSTITAGTLSGTQAICAGLTTTFSSTVSGGTWSTSNNSIATVNASGVVSGVGAGTATITYTIAGVGACPSASATRTVTVTAAPSAGTLSGAQSICLPGTTTFSSTVTGGTWSSSNTSVATVNANGVITGVSVGSATITYTVLGTGGCANATATRTVNVDNVPTAAIITGPGNVCVGDLINLSSSSSSGTWSSSNNSIATVNASAEVSGLAAGTVNIIYTVPANGTCAAVSSSYPVTVNTASPTTLITETICFGDSFLFGGQYYTSNINVVTPILTSSLGCDSGAQLILTVLPEYASANSVQLCLGESYDFFGQTLVNDGVYTEVLSSSAGCDSTVTLNLSFVSQINSNISATICDGDEYVFGTQTLTLADVYIETFVSTGGCDSVVTLDLSVTSLPSGIVVSQNDAELSVNDDFDSYFWFNEADPLTVLGTNPTFTATTSGNYYVAVYNPNGCSALSDVFNVVISGIRNIESLNLSIYPNPAKDMVTIENLPLGSMLELVDLVGKTIYKTTVETPNHILPLDQIAHGVYFLNVTKDSLFLGANKLVVSK